MALGPHFLMERLESGLAQCLQLISSFRRLLVSEWSGRHVLTVFLDWGPVLMYENLEKNDRKPSWTGGKRVTGDINHTWEQGPCPAVDDQRETNSVECLEAFCCFFFYIGLLHIYYDFWFFVFLWNFSVSECVSLCLYFLWFLFGSFASVCSFCLILICLF